MRNTYIENNNYEIALSTYLEHFHNLQGESISSLDTVGRITSQAVFAKVCDPTYNASAMDGIAVNSEDTISATENAPLTLSCDKFEYLNTGNAIGTSFDSVIMIEDVIKNDDGSVKIISPSRPYQHIRVVGESVVATEMILPSFKKIRPIDLGAILASGNSTVNVVKKPTVAIFPTGNEMVESTSDLESGKLLESNTRVFYELIKEYGGIPTRFNIVPDEEKCLKEQIINAVDNFDMIVINAGSSAGTKDFTSKIIAELGTVYTHGLAIKPGKPTILGEIKGKPVIGVPGYPVSAYIVFDLVVRAVIYKLLGISNNEDFGLNNRQTVKAKLTKRIMSTFKNAEFIRVALGDVNGEIVASPLERGAAAVMSMVKADGLITIDRNTEGLEIGEVVDVALMKSLNDIKKSLVVVGSHDVVIDLIADKMPISSAHVGSMGGIMALLHGSAHIAPIHLLDEETGLYNNKFVEQYFPKDSMAIISGLGRMQGILVPKGNPKKITSIEQLKDGQFSFANRQNGAGTRLLFDHLLKKYKIAKSEIFGYDKEYTTHLAVATAVVSGVTDCGLAVLSAANIMNLDFIPVGHEKYEFLISRDFLTDKRIKSFIEILKSQDFKDSVEQMGGYTFESVGDIRFL